MPMDRRITCTEHIGPVEVPGNVSNLCFSGRRHNRLFITAPTAPAAIYLNAQGAQHPHP
ncbi:hypothetical protein [Kaistia soli]|uniref:hypothetical protein n=1 Tax=Kaistia soli TaxID=446684 RepID=UPI001AECCBAB|nr:hypothetical protein [Kaistia soli]